MKTKKELEVLINLLENCMKEEGYATKRFSQTDGKLNTTAYDCLVLRDENGSEYVLSVNESTKKNRKTDKLEATNYLANEIGNMRFFEFNNFDYYALIGANTEEDAINYYEETVCVIEENNGEPEEITKEEARSRIVAIYDSNDEKDIARRKFNKTTLSSEPYLILIDGSLL